MIRISPKAIRFMIEGLERYQGDLDEQLKREGLSDGEVPDLANDR